MIKLLHLVFQNVHQHQVYKFKDQLADTLFKKIIVGRQKTCISRSCIVYAPAEREEDKQNGVEGKCPGHECSYECRDCGATLCVEPCFYIYHNYKEYMGKYIKMKKQ